MKTIILKDRYNVVKFSRWLIREIIINNVH